MKLVVAEPETGALRAALAGLRLVSSELSVTELRRAVRRRPGVPPQRADDVLRALALVTLDRRVLDRAGTLGPPELRSLDAVHLATALDLGPVVSSVMTYDLRLADAARSAGLPVVSPGTA